MYPYARMHADTTSMYANKSPYPLRSRQLTVCDGGSVCKCDRARFQVLQTSRVELADSQPYPCHLVQRVAMNKSWLSFANFFGAGEPILHHHAWVPHLGALVPSCNTSQSLPALLQVSHAPIQPKSLMVEGMEEYPKHQAECITARQQAPMKCLWKIRSTIISEASSLHSRLPLPPPMPCCEQTVLSTAVDCKLQCAGHAVRKLSCLCE